MKYVAIPIQVEAFKIIEVNNDGLDFTILLENGERKKLDPGMTARYTPTIDDYFVITSDGYDYINPKNVFEQKYMLLKYY